MARGKTTVALLLLATFAGGILANDVVLTFLVLDCEGKPVQDVPVKLEGCVDPVDNGGNPFEIKTDVNGTAVFDDNPLVVQYCFGSATGYCKWTATNLKNGVTYESDVPTLQKQGKYVTAREYSGCQCNGQDQCDPVYKYPTITLKPRCCPTTPPTPSCPKTCSFEVTAKRGNKNVKESVQGMCSSSFALEQFAGKSGSAAVCPEGYLNSKQPCKAGQDCGVCCVEATSLCAAKTNGKCAKNGGQCMCQPTKNGATCKNLEFPKFIRHWARKNRNPKCDALGNLLDIDLKEIDFNKFFGAGNWRTNSRGLLTFGNDVDWSAWEQFAAKWKKDNVNDKDYNDDNNGGGCEENLCNAVAAKAGFSAACCPFGCDD